MTVSLDAFGLDLTLEETSFDCAIHAELETLTDFVLDKNWAEETCDMQFSIFELILANNAVPIIFRFIQSTFAHFVIEL